MDPSGFLCLYLETASQTYTEFGGTVAMFLMALRHNSVSFYVFYRSQTYGEFLGIDSEPSLDKKKQTNQKPIKKRRIRAVWLSVQT